jgi:hypothetical protein
MKPWHSAMFALGLMVVTGSAAACPVGSDDVRPNPRPVVSNVNLQASEMIERASRLENAASAREESARMKDQRADTLMTRARMIRNQAVNLVSFSDRQNMNSIADELTIRAAEERNQAANDRSEAASFRMQARNLRERALVLVRGNGGGGWRGRGGAVRDFAAPPPPRDTIL